MPPLPPKKIRKWLRLQLKLKWIQFWTFLDVIYMFTPATAQISTYSYQNNLNTAFLYFRIHTREDRAVGIVRGQRTLLSDDATDLGPQ